MSDSHDGGCVTNGKGREKMRRLVLLLGFLLLSACAASRRVDVSDGMSSPVAATLVDLPKEHKIGDEKIVAGIKFCWCPAGEFMMGSPESEAGRRDNEGPQHKVQITKGFWLGKFEVTQQQWKAVMGCNPSRFKGDNRPVEQVSWQDCQEFIRKLSKNEGGRYSFRLPSEAEWEYACRAGTKSAFYFGDDITPDQVNHIGKSPNGKETRSVGSFPSNAWELHDMHGNVWEWCNDWYSEEGFREVPGKDPRGPRNGSVRVFRGGSWYNQADYCRSAIRYGYLPAERHSILGFRLLLEE